MAVVPWRAPGPTDPDMAFMLRQVHAAQETLDRAVAEAQALPDTEPSRSARLLRYTALQREVERTYTQVTRLARGWATNDLPVVYATGHLAAALQLNATAGFDVIHKDAVAVLSQDAYRDVATGLQQVPRGFADRVRAQRQLELLGQDRRQLIQVGARELVAQQLLVGDLSPADAARILRDKLWAEGVPIIDRAGRSWNAESYTRMLIRTKSANAFNVGTLNKARQEGISRVLVFDGIHDQECAKANGQIWTMDYAYSHVIAHPNCRRAFAPQPGRGVLHRATLQETARFAGLAVVDELVIAAFLRTVRHWDAVGSINVIPPQLRESLDRFETTAGILERFEYMEAWLTEQFMPTIEQLATLTAPGMGDRLRNAAIERLERRVPELRRAELQLMAEVPPAISVAAPQSQAARSAALVVRDRLGTDQIREPTNMLHPGLYGIDPHVDELMDLFLEDAIQIFELTDAMRASGDAHLIEMARLLDEASESDVESLIQKHFGDDIVTFLGGGANSSIPVVRINDQEWIVKHINASVTEVYPAFVAEEWTTYLARLLNMPRLDSALVRLDPRGDTGIILQRYASGWQTFSELRFAGDFDGDLPAKLLFRGTDVGRRMSLLNIMIANMDAHDANWLVSAPPLATGQQITQAQVMMIDLETALGIPWQMAPRRAERPVFGPAEIERWETIRLQPRDAGAGIPWDQAIGPNVSPAEYVSFATIKLTPQENELLRAIIEGAHDDALIRVASAFPEGDELLLPNRYIDAALNPDAPWVPILQARVEEIKERLRRAYAAGYLDDGTRTMTFADREVTVGEVVAFDLPPVDPADVPVVFGTRRPQNPLNIRNAVEPGALTRVQGRVWHLWEDVNGDRWIAIAHGLPIKTTVGGEPQTWAGFKVLRESDVVAGEVLPVVLPTRVTLSPLLVDELIPLRRIRHDWTPSRPSVDLTDLEWEMGINEIKAVLDNTINDVMENVSSNLSPSEVRLARIEVDGVEIPGAYHPRGAQADHEFLQELAESGGVVVNPEKLIDGLEGFWVAWKAGRGDDAEDALDLSRFERVLRHELGHAIADARSRELREQVAAIAFETIRRDRGWLDEILPGVDLETLPEFAVRQVLQSEVDRYTAVVTGKIEATLRDEVRRVMQQKYGVVDDATVNNLPEWLRYAGNVYLGRFEEAGLDFLREFEGDLIGHLLETDNFGELSRLERLFTLTDLPDLPANRQELNEIEGWLQGWYKENRQPSVGLQLMAEQTGLPRHRLRRITELQDVPGEFTDEGVIRQVYEHDFGDFRTEVSNILAKDNGITSITGIVRDNSTRELAGSFTRKVTRNADGTVDVYHASLFMYEDYQGRGWGTEFFEYTEDWYVAKGVRQITVETTQVGGYNWARRGYGFKRTEKAVEFLRPMNVIDHVPARDKDADILYDVANEVLMRIWLRDPGFVLENIEREGPYLDLWRFTEHVRDEQWYRSTPDIAEELFLETFDALEWRWYGIREEDAIRARELYEIIVQQGGFEPTLGSEALRWAGMGAIPIPWKNVDGDVTWMQGIREWEQLLDDLYPNELELFRRGNVAEFSLVRDAVMHPSYRVAGPTQAFQALRRTAAEMIEQEWTPFRISQLASGLPFPDPARGGKESWLGKELMMNTAWDGVKPLDVLRHDFKEQVFRELRLAEIAETTPAFNVVDQRRDLEKVLAFVNTVIAKLEQVDNEIMVLPFVDFVHPDFDVGTMVWERVGNEVRVIQRSPTVFTDDDQRMDWARNVTEARRQVAWFDRPDEVRTIEQWNEMAARSDTIRTDSWQLEAFQDVAQKIEDALLDSSVAFKDSRLLPTFMTLSVTTQLGIPGVGPVTDFIQVYDTIQRLFKTFDNLGTARTLTVEQLIDARLNVDTSPVQQHSLLPDTISDRWAQGTVVRDYAGATTYFAFNSQLRRERGIHNSSLAMQRALRRDYDAGPGYSFPGWELTFRQTSLTLDYWEELVGREWISEGYLSTAFSPRNIGGFAAGDQSRHIMIVVRIPEELQRHARFINSGEAEVLYAPGSRFAVRGIFEGTIDGRFSDSIVNDTTPYSLVVVDYLHTAPRDVPAFGGWREVRRDFQYVSSIKRGDSVRFRMRPTPTIGNPLADQWVEGIVVGVTDASVTVARFVDGRVSTNDFIPWTNIFEMDVARPVDLDPPLGEVALGYVEVDRREFLRVFGTTSTDEAMTIRANRIVRLELQTGQVVEGYVGRFVGGLTETQVVTDQGIFELGWVRRFMYSINDVPAASGYLTVLDQALRDLVLEIRVNIPAIGALMTPHRLANRFRDLAVLLADNPSTLDNLGTYGNEQRMLVQALLGGHTSEFSLEEMSNMMENSINIRSPLSRLARELDRIDGLGVFEDGMTTLIPANVPALLLRMAAVIESDELLAPPVPPSIGGPTVHVPTQQAFSSVMGALEEMPVETMSGEVFELNADEVIEAIDAFSEIVDPGIMGGPAGIGLWHHLLIGGDEQVLGTELFNDVAPAVEPLVIALQMLANAVVLELNSQVGSLPTLQQVLVQVSFLLKHPEEVLGLMHLAPGVIQLPSMTDTLVAQLDMIDLTPLNLAVALQQNAMDPLLFNDPVVALELTIANLKAEAAEKVHVNLEDWELDFIDLPNDLQFTILKLDEVQELLLAPGMIDQFDLTHEVATWLSTLGDVAGAGPIVVEIEISEALLQQLVDTLDEFHLPPDVVAHELASIVPAEGPVAPGNVYIDEMFAGDVFQLQEEGWNSNEILVLHNLLVDVLMDPGIDNDVKKLIQLLREMAL